MVVTVKVADCSGTINSCGSGWSVITGGSTTEGGGREVGREGGREGWREGGMEGGREGWKEGGRRGMNGVKRER